MYKFLSSPNYNERVGNSVINSIIIHHTKLKSNKEALDLMCDSTHQAASHYLISKDGEIIQLIEDKYRAWHAGKSFWRGAEDLNSRSIGIELDNNGEEPFTLEQMKSLLKLCKELKQKFPTIEQRNIIGHSDIAIFRKDDPSHLLDWEWLAKNGIGIYPEINRNFINTFLFKLNDEIEEIKSIQSKLQEYGYQIEINGKYDEWMEQVVVAFKRHFCPLSFFANTQNIWDTEADLMLNRLIEIIND